MKITSIKNRKTGDDVCKHYCGKNLKMHKCIIKKGNPLVIVYENSTFFVHEDVLEVKKLSENVMIIETTKKTWSLED